MSIGNINIKGAITMFNQNEISKMVQVKFYELEMQDDRVECYKLERDYTNGDTLDI